MQLQLLVLPLHQKYTYRSRFIIVVDVRLSDDDWPKMSREAQKLAVDHDHGHLSYVHIWICLLFILLILVGIMYSCHFIPERYDLFS